MAIPERVSSIMVSDTVMYSGNLVISWEAVTGVTGYKLYISADGASYSELYSGTALTYTLTVSTACPDASKLKFRVYAVNGDGCSAYPCESKEVTVIDWFIEDLSDGTIILRPFDLIVNSYSTKIDDVPAVRETAETIAGLDGEIPVDMKYSPRLFDLVTFMKSEFSSVAQREAFIKEKSSHINRSVRALRYLKYRSKLFGVKRISSEFSRYPTRCNLDISLKAYDIFGYGLGENIVYGNGSCVNGGDVECYPIIILEGALNNPTITVNGVDYQLALDTLAGDIITVDCEKETVTRERSGVITYVTGVLSVDYPVFKVGTNTISGAYVVKWRNKYFAI